MKIRVQVTLLVLFLALAIASPALAAYEYPLSSSAIREAYFLGTGPTRGDADFLAQYSHTIAKLTAGSYTSVAKIETPYSQVAERAAETLNYSVDDAVKEFLGKAIDFRMNLDICVKSGAEKPIQIKVLQHGKEIVPRSAHHSPYFAPQEPDISLPRIGEHIQLVFDASRIDASPLVIEIDAGNGQHAENTFDLTTLK